MDIHTGYAGRAENIAALMQNTFTAAADAAEGRVVGGLVRDVLAGPADDLFVFCAYEEAILAGAVLFTRIVYSDDNRCVFLLSPMAVSPASQGKGLGQALIHDAVRHLRANGVDILLTYGDPAFYGKTGFVRVTQDFAAAPYPLSQPEGWQVKALTDAPLTPLRGTPRTATAFNNPALW